MRHNSYCTYLVERYVFDSDTSRQVHLRIANEALGLFVCGVQKSCRSHHRPPIDGNLLQPPARIELHVNRRDGIGCIISTSCYSRTHHTRLNFHGKRPGLHNSATNHARFLLIQGPPPRQIPRLDDPISLDGRQEMIVMILYSLLQPVLFGFSKYQLEMIWLAEELDFGGSLLFVVWIRNLVGTGFGPEHRPEP